MVRKCNIFAFLLHVKVFEHGKGDDGVCDMKSFLVTQHINPDWADLCMVSLISP